MLGQFPVLWAQKLDRSRAIGAYQGLAPRRVPKQGSRGTQPPHLPLASIYCFPGCEGWNCGTIFSHIR